MRKLCHDIPAASVSGASEGSRDRFVDTLRRQISWAGRDGVTRTYVTSRKLVPTRVVANRRDFRTFGGFDPPLLHPIFTEKNRGYRRPGQAVPRFVPRTWSKRATAAA
jgi:hypothetical protein